MSYVVYTTKCVLPYPHPHGAPPTRWWWPPTWPLACPTKRRVLSQLKAKLVAEPWVSQSDCTFSPPSTERRAPRFFSGTLGSKSAGESIRYPHQTWPHHWLGSLHSATCTYQTIEYSLWTLPQQPRVPQMQCMLECQMCPFSPVGVAGACHHNPSPTARRTHCKLLQLSGQFVEGSEAEEGVSANTAVGGESGAGGGTEGRVEERGRGEGQRGGVEGRGREGDKER